MSAIDHAALAVELLDQADHTSMKSHEAASVLATMAQAHATLALADQQRIANIFALASLEPGNTEAYWRTVVATPRGERGLDLVPWIAKALGL